MAVGWVNSSPRQLVPCQLVPEADLTLVLILNPNNKPNPNSDPYRKLNPNIKLNPNLNHNEF